MIEVNNVVKDFDDFRALSGTTLHIEKGSIYGLVGPNGAGKSTIIRAITGIYKINSGKITIDGEEVYDNTNVKQKVAYIPDDIFYHAGASLDTMAKFYRDTYKNFDMELYHNLKEYFPKLNAKKKIRTMSKGMQKQAAFILSIAIRPEVIILDEPVDGLDPLMRKQVWSLLMKEVAEREVTVLVSSHNLRELEDVCDHVGIMLDGKIIVEKSLEDMQENTMKVQMAFDGEVPVLEDSLEVLHKSKMGKVVTIIVRGNEKEVSEKINALKPMFYDLIPLTLEEIFIYELGGSEYEVKEILL